MRLTSVSFACLTVALTAVPALAASVNSYQVTGPVLELTDSKITVQKDKEKWEIARDSGTKLPDSVKIGSKVTVRYSMTALAVEDKGAAPADKAAASGMPAPKKAK